MANSSPGILKVIGASSVGTMIEWYDFYIFGSLAPIISKQFFPQDNPTAAFLSTLATFAAGFVVRPFGALFFGRLGDLLGRKYTFMVTLLIMGGATFLIGCVPSYKSIGFAAPILVLLLRLLQGLALGGEYGGAATYVAEHAPANKRGYFTSWIQTTATLGLFISLLVIMGAKKSIGETAFGDWGWRIPFWVSIIMVGVSYLIRKKMDESPLFAKAKAEGKISGNPLKESFGNKFNFKFVLLALLGATMGQGVIWYTGHYYAMNFLKIDCRVDAFQVEEMMTWAFLLGTPFFVLFGWLSDKVGRKPIMLCGMALAVLCYFPIYEKMYEKATTNNGIVLIQPNALTLPTVKIVADGKIDSTITQIENSGYTDGTQLFTRKQKIFYSSGKVETKEDTVFTLGSSSYRWLIFLVFLQVIFVTMVYGPIAAFLVEMFPTKIRYTSMSLPYHIGNGVFGGLMPAVASYLTTTSKTASQANWYIQGIWYPVVISALCFIIGLLFLNEKDKRINDL